MSQIEDETVLGLRIIELTDGDSQWTKWKLLKIVNTESKKSFADTEMQHTDEVFEGNQRVNEFMSCLLKVFKQEEEILINDEDMFLVIKETR